MYRNTWLWLRRHLERRQVQTDIWLRKQKLLRLWHLQVVLGLAVGIHNGTSSFPIPPIEHLKSFCNARFGELKKDGWGLPISFSEYGTESKRFKYLLWDDRVGQILLKSWKQINGFWNWSNTILWGFLLVFNTWSKTCKYLRKVKDTRCGVKEKITRHLCLREFFFRVH